MLAVDFIMGVSAFAEGFQYKPHVTKGLRISREIADVHLFSNLGEPRGYFYFGKVIHIYNLFYSILGNDV